MSSKNHTEYGCHGHDLDSLVICALILLPRDLAHAFKQQNKGTFPFNWKKKHCMHPMP